MDINPPTLTIDRFLLDLDLPFPELWFALLTLRSTVAGCTAATSTTTTAAFTTIAIAPITVTPLVVAAFLRPIAIPRTATLALAILVPVPTAITLPVPLLLPPIATIVHFALAATPSPAAILRPAAVAPITITRTRPSALEPCGRRGRRSSN